MKKVLFAIHSLGFGGAERSLVNLLNELPEDQYQVDLLIFQRREGFASQVPGWVNMLEIPPEIHRLYGKLGSRWKYPLVRLAGTGISRLARKGKKAQKAFRWKRFYRPYIKNLPGHYDVAVAYVGAEIMYYIRDCVSADRKLVWIHNDYRAAAYSKKDDAPYFVDMDEIASVSQQCVDVLKEEFPEHAHKMHNIENITSSAVIRSMAQAYTPEEYSGNKANILSVGRLWPQKGFDMAVDAAAILKQRGLDFCWYVVGAGSLESELRRQIRELSLEKEFVLLGQRSNPYPYIRNCDLLVQPSRYEGKSVVLDEAKILCKPIVATAYPTVADQIADGLEGRICKMSPEGIADGILEMLENDALRSSVEAYLADHEYGNQSEVEKYMRLIDGE